MTQACLIMGVVAAGAMVAATRAGSAPALRAPAVPLVTHDPFFSTWSMTDRLADDWPRHWTGHVRGMSGLVRVDGQTMRWMAPGPERHAPSIRSPSAFPRRRPDRKSVV